jgi:inorganic pyrophosphatase-like protein
MIPALGATSPRLMGEAAYRAGQVSRIPARAIGRSAYQVGRLPLAEGGSVDFPSIEEERKNRARDVFKLRQYRPTENVDPQMWQDEREIPYSPLKQDPEYELGWEGHASTGGRFAHGGRVEPDNINHDPTEAQKKAGNYAKDHVHIHGLDITIENAKGAMRSGVDRGGKPWSVKMPAHYGYIKGTVGKDKDHVDVYVGTHQRSPHVFVVDQVDADSAKFDEHKAFLGFSSKEQAKKAYLAAFSDGKGQQRLGHMAEMSVDTFKRWLVNGDTEKRIKGAEHDHKLSHKAVGYVDKSRVSNHCAVCSMFREGPHCTLVKDPIHPAGWCRRFDPKKD